jgi:hypothetical protein
MILTRLHNLHRRTCTHSLQHLGFLFSFNLELAKEVLQSWSFQAMAVADNVKDIAKDIKKSRSPGLYTRNKSQNSNASIETFTMKIYIKTNSTSLIEK